VGILTTLLEIICFNPEDGKFLHQMILFIVMKLCWKCKKEY